MNWIQESAKIASHRDCSVNLYIVNLQWGAFCLWSSFQGFPIDMVSPPDSYAWNCKENATLLTPSKGLAEGGFEPLSIGSIHRNFTNDTYCIYLRSGTAFWWLTCARTIKQGVFGLNLVRFILKRLHAGQRQRIDARFADKCPQCEQTLSDTVHLFRCCRKPVRCKLEDIWRGPVKVAAVLDQAQ